MWQAFLDGLAILSQNWVVSLGALTILSLGCAPCFFSARTRLKKKSRIWGTVILLSIFFIVSLILRLAFLTETFVPPYFDSVEHYRIIKQLLVALKVSSLLEAIPSLTPSYYHLGFHFSASLLAFGLQADPMEVILLMGQVILAAIPIPIYFLIWYETQSELAAFFSMLTAGFGWYMPGFAVNWGKYPALMGILALEIVLTAAYYYPRNNSARNAFFVTTSLLLGTAVSTLFHTRTAAIIVIAAVSWSITRKIRTLSMIFQYLILVILLAAISVLGMAIHAEPQLSLALDPYLGDGLWITLTVLALSPFALMKFSRGFYLSILLLLGILATLFIPADIPLPGLEYQTILDRPFVEMLIYLPLSILGGLGLAGLLQVLKFTALLSEKINPYSRAMIAVLFVGFAGFITIGRYDYYPSDCCNFIKYDDTIAFDWIDKNFPPDAHILTAASQLSVLLTGPSDNLVGTDAGIWIPALTDRNITLETFDTDFLSASTQIDLCQKQVGYIYIGGTEQSFNAAQLQAKAAWYERVFFLPNAQLYQLKGCSN